MLQEIRGILVDAIRPRLLQLVFPVAAREQPDAERVGAPRGEQVPLAVAHHDRLFDRDAEPPGRRQEQVGIGLGVLHLIARHHRHAGGDTERIEQRLRAFESSAGRDGPRDTGLGEIAEQLARARQRPHALHLAREGLLVDALHPGGLLDRHAAPGLAQQRVQEQAAAHADAPVDAPDGELDPGALERVTPGEHVLVHAVHQRAVEIEEKRRAAQSCSITAAAASRVLAVPPRSLVRTPATSASFTARSTRRAASACPSCSNIRAPVRIAASGLATPLPASGGADPCTGSNSPARPGWRLALAARPSPPTSPAPKSERMSPYKLLVTMT